MRNTKWQKNLDAFYSLSSSAPERLIEVYQKITDTCRAKLVLVFTHQVLIFHANADDDTISIQARALKAFHNRESFQKSSAAVWHQFIGKPFGWGWVAVNQQGYCDGVLLSFDGVTPNLFLEVIASSISVSVVVPQEDQTRLEILEENGKWSVRQVPLRLINATPAATNLLELPPRRDLGFVLDRK
jgi:hypothetical protein